MKEKMKEMKTFPLCHRSLFLKTSTACSHQPRWQRCRLPKHCVRLARTFCDFGAGEPDFDTPDNIKQAAAKAMHAGRTKYTAAGGIREINRAIIDFYKREFRTEYQPSEVMATAGKAGVQCRSIPATSA